MCQPKNISGKNIAVLRKRQKPEISQRALAEKMQLLNVNVDKNAIQRIESGKRKVSDIELKTIAIIFNVSPDELLNSDLKFPKP